MATTFSSSKLNNRPVARKVITPACTLSYPSLFEPREGPNGGAPKYGCALIFDQDADISGLREAALAVARERWGDRADRMIRSGQLRLPFRAGAEKAGQKGYGPGKIFLNVRANDRPGVVGRYAASDGRPLEITDPAEVYPGCQVRASLSPFAYDVSGNRGVSFGLRNVQKLADGERLDGRLAARDEFEALEHGPAPLDDEDDEDFGDILK